MSTAPVDRSTADSAWIRAEFPALAGSPVSYLDNASTTQKPQQVVEAVAAVLAGGAASPGRGGYPWATRLVGEVDRVRGTMARFLGVDGPDGVVFTAGATAAMNAVAWSWGLHTLTNGDEILYSPDDHTSTIAPWTALRDTLGRFGIRIRLVPYARDNPSSVAAAVTTRTRLIVATHVHSITGNELAPQDIRAAVGPAVLLCLDCSQSAGHVRLADVASTADFVIVAGHKMFAAPGIGILWCARHTHSRLRPYPSGGTGAGVDPTRMPYLLEAGTPDIPAIMSLGAAVDFIRRVGIDAIESHNAAAVRRIFHRLASVPGIEFRSTPTASSGIVALRVRGVRAGDVGFVLAASNVYVRAGGHCVTGADGEVVRISAHIYNTRAEIDKACDVLAAIAEEGH